ncbi:hypothetical protein [Flavobacterium cerinum]|uniref:Uncharacterized protein n=1 Tax=Flavobacterium cerinum TaxID=2502784 RepID=A0A444HAY0_9FLAO|nr:hypothetical protein [Flavobacterium cerinum]RWX00406.1 hypothetical protein EPI11_09005 [Flavobacterium cerinum]
MGWFGRLFEKKPRGSKAGNALRMWAYKKTFGLLGTENGRPEDPWVVPKEAKNISNTVEGSGNGNQMWWGE